MRIGFLLPDLKKPLSEEERKKYKKKKVDRYDDDSEEEVDEGGYEGNLCASAKSEFIWKLRLQYWIIPPLSFFYD